MPILLRKTFLLLLLLSSAFLSYGQYITPFGIKGLSKSKGDKIWLRWAPTRPEVWLAANKTGYIVERFMVKKDGLLEEPKSTLLTPTPLKPISKEAMERLQDPLAPALAEMLYTESLPLKSRNPKDIIDKKEQIDNRFGMALFVADLSQPLALASGLMIIDNQGLVAGKRYVYRIKLAVVPANMPAMEEGIAIVDFLPEIPIATPEAPVVVFADKKAVIKWDVALYKGTFSGYMIERSEDGKKYNNVNKLPFTPVSEDKSDTRAVYADSLSDNRTNYYYRLRGINAFGETSPPSAAFKGKGKDDLFGATVIKDIKIIENKTAQITWTFPEGYLKEIKGFKVRFASSAAGVYADAHSGLLSDKDRDFNHQPPFLNTYYYVQAIDTENEIRSQSFPFLAQKEDHDPPAQPQNLMGKVDTTNKKYAVAVLSWEMGKEKDLLGYRVFRTNGSGEEFTELTRVLLTKNIFRDTLITSVLTKDVYYRIMSMDQVYNPSEPSKTILLRRPDKVAPAAPLFTNYKAQEDGVLLLWDNSPSTDIANYQLFRENKDSTDLLAKTTKIKNNRKIALWTLRELAKKEIVKDNKGIFIDKTAILGTTYIYTLAAVDSAGNAGKTQTGDILFETGRRKALEVQPFVDREKRQITLSWKPVDASMEVASCYIFRAKEKEPLRLYQTITGDPGKFEDTDLKINNTYTYKVQVLFKKRVRSIMTDPILVKY